MLGSASLFIFVPGFGHPGTYPKKPGGFFLGKPTLKNPAKNPAKKTQPKTIKFCMSYSTVIKKFFTTGRLKDVNV